MEQESISEGTVFNRNRGFHFS